MIAESILLGGVVYGALINRMVDRDGEKQLRAKVRNEVIEEMKAEIARASKALPPGK